MTSAIQIGPYFQGEVPEPFTHQMEQSPGTPLPLTGGYTAYVTLAKGDADSVEAAAVVSSEANGDITYTWAAGDTDTVGKVTVIFWATNGDRVLASPIHVLRVLAAN